MSISSVNRHILSVHRFNNLTISTNFIKKIFVAIDRLNFDMLLNVSKTSKVVFFVLSDRIDNNGNMEGPGSRRAPTST